MSGDAISNPLEQQYATVAMIEELRETMNNSFVEVRRMMVNLLHMQSIETVPRTINLRNNRINRRLVVHNPIYNGDSTDEEVEDYVLREDQRENHQRDF